VTAGGNTTPAGWRRPTSSQPTKTPAGAAADAGESRWAACGRATLLPTPPCRSPSARHPVPEGPFWPPRRLSATSFALRAAAHRAPRLLLYGDRCPPLTHCSSSSIIRSTSTLIRVDAAHRAGAAGRHVRRIPMQAPSPIHAPLRAATPTQPWSRIYLDTCGQTRARCQADLQHWSADPALFGPDHLSSR